MEVTRHSLLERQMSLIQHYFQRLDDMNDMYAQGHEWAQEALRSFDQEWQQLQAQQYWALSMAHKDKRAAQLVVSFPERASKLLMQVEPQAALRWFEDALAWVDAEDYKTRYQLLHRSRVIWRYRGNSKRISEIVDDLAALAERMDDDYRRAEAAQLKAEYYEMVQDYESALRWAEQSLALALRLEDQKSIAEAYYQLGGACARLHQASRAETYLKISLDFYQQLGSRFDESFIWTSLALNAYNWGKYKAAVEYNEQALVIIRELGDRRRELNQLGNLANFVMSTGDLQKALFYSRQTWALAVETGMVSAQQNTLGALLPTLAELGLIDELNVFLEQARIHLRDYPAPTLQSIVEGILVELAAEQGDWETACRIAARSVIADRSQGLLDREYVSTLMWGQCLLELGSLDEAATVFSDYLKTGNLQSENPVWHACIVAALSYVEVRRGSTKEAQKFLDTFFTMLADDGILKMDRAFLSLWNVHRTCIALGDPHVPFLLEQFEKLLQHYVGHLHDEALRASFLKQNTIQYLIAVRAQQ